jgi:signal transduction histidine kinase/CheY-like chemotaxis protein/HPt (histidine-containing phosphotransfer) domain-containing protein
MNLLNLLNITGSFFNEMPVIYVLIIIITGLVIWLIIENIKSRKSSFSLGISSSNKLSANLLNRLPLPTLYYDFSYQLQGMNNAAKKHFANMNINELINSKPFDEVFINKNLLNYLDEIIVNETPQHFPVYINHNNKIYHYDATIMISDDNKSLHKQLILILQSTTTLHEKIKNSENLVREKQEELTKIISSSKETEAQRAELEKAFKHSSKHHIQLQKALLENERQRKQLQEAVEVINKQKEELKHANEEIKHHSRMKEIFFANTSHEIRTPLNAIIGFTNLLLNMEPNSKQLAYLRNIKASGDNLLIVLNDILDFSKIEAGKLTFEKISFLLTEQIDLLINTMKVKADEGQLLIKYYVDPELPEVLIGDPTRLNQILMNLIGNAIKFTDPKGTIELRISKNKDIKSNVEIKFEVIDTGIGISKEKISRIFNSFTQAENETTRKYGGTGLGLAIVKQLVELQNGEIFVNSKEGKGSTFTFYLTFPVGRFSNVHKAAEHIEKQLANPESIFILIAEDNKINQQLAIDTIKSWENNINIDVAENGKLAIEMLENKRYHMVFMDIQMPEMDGIEATKHIRNKFPDDYKKLPIIAMTAHALKNERDHFIKAGIDDYISKPFAPEVLTQKISFYSSEKVQEKVKSGEPFQTLLETGDDSDKSDIEIISKSEHSEFKYLDLSYLEKLYKYDYKRIKKILLMYVESVQKEVNEVFESYQNEDFEKARAKAHALKPKMTYLGCNDLHENAKNIEQTIKQNGDIKPLIDDVNNLKEKWPLVEEEIKKFINN